MAIDPNVQVAIVSAIATLITTLGVVIVALISKPEQKNKASNLSTSEVRDGYDELVEENKKLKDDIQRLQTVNEYLEEEVYRRKRR